MLDKKSQLLNHFLSLTFVLEPNSDSSDFLVPYEKLLQWLERYDSWKKKSADLDIEHRPFLWYGQSLTIVGSGLFSCPETSQKLLARISELGYNITLHADFMEAYENFSMLEAFCESSCVSSLAIFACDLDPELSPDKLEAFWQKLRSLRRIINISGSVDELRAYGLFSSPALNSSDLSISTYNRNLQIKAPMGISKPCNNRMTLYIDADGSLYPCFGLLGLQEYALGSVYDDDEDEVIHLDRYPLDLQKLMCQGPDIPQQGDVSPHPNLPWLCRRHRSELTRKAKDE